MLLLSQIFQEAHSQRHRRDCHQPCKEYAGLPRIPHRIDSSAVGVVPPLRLVHGSETLSHGLHGSGWPGNEIETATTERLVSPGRMAGASEGLPSAKMNHIKYKGFITSYTAVCTKKSTKQ